MDKNFYNESSAQKLGWDPTWFNEKYFDDALVYSIKEWQLNHNITPDGLCGPSTYRRIWTHRQANISNYTPNPSPYLLGKIRNGNKYIVHNSNFIPIEWDKIILWDDEAGLSIDSGNYYDYSGKKDRSPTMFVNHWDVCLDSTSCAKVLNKRGISVHFCIDNDGTIYQLLDTQHGAWHAGCTVGNRKGIGVEISNAYYTKYQSWYKSNGFGERPIIKDAIIHGKKSKEFLGFYPVQLQALQALWKACSQGIGIPMEYPQNSDKSLNTGVHRVCQTGSFKGICNHYNFTRNKIDCAGLELDKLIKECNGQ